MSHSTQEIDEVNVLCTYGALFFGVPSTGMDVEAIAEMIGDLPARTTLHELDRRIGQRLKSRQHNQFCESVYSDSVIVRFFELSPTPTVVPVGRSLTCFACRRSLTFQRTQLPLMASPVEAHLNSW